MSRRRLLPLLLLLPVLLGARTAPGTESDPFTRTDLRNSLFAAPSLLGLSRSFGLSYSAYYSGDGITDNHRLALSGYGFGFSFRKEAGATGVLRRYTAGWGFTLPGKNTALGLALDWFGSGDDARLDGLALLRFSLSRTFGNFLLLSLGMQDIVLADHAWGLVVPGFFAGTGLRLFGGFMELHLGLEWSREASLADAAKQAVLLVRPLAGVEVGFEYNRRDGEDRFGIALSLGMGQFRTSSRLLLDKNATGSRVVFDVDSASRAGLFGQGRKVVMVDIAANILNQPETQGFLKQSRPLTWLDLLAGIDRAARDPSVMMLYLRVGQNNLGYGRTEELVSVLRRFKKTGKRVYAYLESGRTLDYALASTADRVYLQPEVQLRFTGVGVTVTFLKGLFDKIGLKAEILYKGKYKTAAQQLTLDGITPEHREAEQLLIRRMHEFLVRTIAENRAGGDIAKVDAWFRQGLWHADEAVKQGIINKDWTDQEVQKVFPAFGLQLVPLAGYLKTDPASGQWGALPSIAVVNINGSIVNGKSGRSPLPLFGGTTAGADTVVETVRHAASRPGVRAIVIRVQSGGGDLVASDKMWRAINAVSAVKKVYISFGDVAASGGYYLACGDAGKRTRIYAPGTCITGSIGVFTGKVVTAGLREKMGLKTFFLEEGKGAFFWSGNRPYGEEELRMLRHSLDRYYEGFVRKVAVGRGLSFTAAEEVAQGRVWSGQDALERKLLDGNLDLWSVVELAARENGLKAGGYRLLELPVHKAGILPGLPGVDALGLLRSLVSEGHPLGLFLQGAPLAMLPYAADYQ